jgi:hypothetical protein
LKVITTSILTSPAKLFVSLFTIFSITSSCEDPSSIGLILDPENNQIGVFYQEIPLSATVFMRDSLSTTNTGFLVYGIEESDFFGDTEAIGYSRLFFNRDIRKPEQNAILDSVIFNINMVNVLGNDLSDSKTIAVHVLNEQIEDKLYYNFSSLDYDPDPIISASFNFSNRQDTLLSFPIANDFTQNVFEELKNGDAFTDIFTFREFLPGLVFKGVDNENVSFSTRVGNNTGMVFFYKNEGDTISRAYPISTGINNNFARHFSQVINDPTGTPTEVIDRKTVDFDLGPMAGGKSLLGLLVKLDMSPLDAFLDTLENVTFNQVTLEFGPLQNNIATNRPPQFQIMYFTNETNEILLRSDGLPMAVQPDGRPQIDNDKKEPLYSEGPALLIHSRQNNIYSQFITSHVSSIYRKQIQRRDFILNPGSPVGDDFRRSLSEYVFEKNTIKLKIFFSSARSL